MTRKYFFFDIDGTLIPSGYADSRIPDSALNAIEQLKQKGHFVSIATGRAEALAHQTRLDLGFDNMVSDGGNGITIDGYILEIEPIDHDAVNDLVDQCKELGIPWALSPYNMDHRWAPDESFYEYTHDTYIPTVVRKDLNPRNYPQILKAYVACKAGDEEKLPALKRLPWARFHDTYIFVEPTSKAKGIRKIVDHFGGKYEDVVVFGDAMNDLSMFLDEWTCIAMGNACDELKEKATYITTDVDKDGIYNACKHFGWID